MKCVSTDMLDKTFCEVVFPCFRLSTGCGVAWVDVGLSFCRWILCRFYVVVYQVFVSSRVACFLSVHYRRSVSVFSPRVFLAFHDLAWS